MYVTDSNLNEIYEISGTKIATVSCTCLDGPEAITYDPSLLYMVVTNYVSGTIASITGTLFGPTEPVGKQPDAIVFNAYTNGIVVANSGSNNLTAFDASPLLLRGSIPVGKDPSGLAYDPENGYTYVANTGSNNVTILDGAILIGSIRGFDRPTGVSWDQAALEIYVSNLGNGKVYAVNATGDIAKKFATASGSDPYGLVYDSSNHDVYAVGLITDKVYILA